jgi:hypothetical protein
VFTPKIQGEKVFPLFWSKVIAAPPSEAIENAVQLLRVRYAFSILCVIIPGFSLILVLYTIYAVHTSSASASEAADTVSKTPEPSAPEGGKEIALTGGVYDKGNTI